MFSLLYSYSLSILLYLFMFIYIDIFLSFFTRFQTMDINSSHEPLFISETRFEVPEEKAHKTENAHAQLTDEKLSKRKSDGTKLKDRKKISKVRNLFEHLPIVEGEKKLQGVKNVVLFIYLSLLMVLGIC